MSHSDDNEQDAYVLVRGDEIPLHRVKFMGIHEGVYGEDRVTFRYQGRFYESPVIRRR
tara:strand:+ start:3811 stop:3984 length:174 start_codon:yes stop_codon:yes gene_type:complete